MRIYTGRTPLLFPALRLMLLTILLYFLIGFAAILATVFLLAKQE